MPECINCDAYTQKGSWCPMCRVERDNDHHDFFGETPEEKADRLLGKSINHSSNGLEDDAEAALDDARGAMPDVSYDVWRHMQAAQTVETTSSEYRRYLREARQFLEGVRDGPEVEGAA